MNLNPLGKFLENHQNGIFFDLSGYGYEFNIN
jgi:hypothetical protein